MLSGGICASISLDLWCRVLCQQWHDTWSFLRMPFVDSAIWEAPWSKYFAKAGDNLVWRCFVYYYACVNLICLSFNIWMLQEHRINSSALRWFGLFLTSWPCSGLNWLWDGFSSNRVTGKVIILSDSWIRLTCNAILLTTTYWRYARRLWCSLKTTCGSLHIVRWLTVWPLLLIRLTLTHVLIILLS